jgi:hypothetical protein
MSSDAFTWLVVVPASALALGLAVTGIGIVFSQLEYRRRDRLRARREKLSDG